MGPLMENNTNTNLQQMEFALMLPEDTGEKETSSNFKFFDEVLKDQLEQTNKILGLKGKEYSTEQDRFSNFKAAARIEKVSPEKALLGMMVKHEVSVRDIVDSLDEKLPNEAMLNEKIGDWINYLILLKGMILERVRR